MARTRTSSDLELLVPLQREGAGAEPLHRQLEQRLRADIRTGRLAAATALPSSRALAAQLGISRGIVVEAYEQLVAECYLDVTPGGITRVARIPDVVPARAAQVAAAPVEFDFRPGRPDLDEFPRAVWLRSLRRVLNEAPSERLGYLDGRGTPELRAALAAYLNRVRGTAAAPADIVVTTGFKQAIGLLARVLRSAGARTVAVEDPSDPEYRETIREAGLSVVGVPVDASGLRVDLLAATPADAVIVTAAHQYPLGGVLPADRRAALIAWAKARNSLVVEDDYDAEFRYDRAPIGTLQGLAPAHVAYAGSASKILAPGLRLGWLIAPPQFVEPLAAAKVSADMGSAALDQLAFADVLERGELDRHLRRMRSVYRRRRDALLSALAENLPDIRPTGASAGLHLVAWLPAGLDEDRVVSDAAVAGIGISGLRPRRIAPGPGGLVFGYGGIREEAIRPAVRRLAEVLRSAA